MFHTLMVLGAILIFSKRGKACKDSEVKRIWSSSACILFSPHSGQCGGRQAEHEEAFSSDNLIWRNMVEIFISVGYAYIVVNWSLKDPPASSQARAQSHHGSEEERKRGRF